MTGKKLIVIEGFDRCGKDSLINDLKSTNQGFYLYECSLEGLPKYDKEQDDFLVWLNNLIYNQITTLNKIFENNDIVIMSRLIVSDEVYSKMFNREHTVKKYMPLLRNDVTIFNYCLIFKTYDEYLKRLKIINDNNIQYDEQNFNKINELYKNEIEKQGTHNHIKEVLAAETRKDIEYDFLTYLDKIKNL